MFKIKPNQALIETQWQLDGLQQHLDAIKKHVGYVELSPEGNLLFANPIFLGWLGYRTYNDDAFS